MPLYNIYVYTLRSFYHGGFLAFLKALGLLIPSHSPSSALLSHFPFHLALPTSMFLGKFWTGYINGLAWVIWVLCLDAEGLAWINSERKFCFNAYDFFIGQNYVLATCRKIYFGLSHPEIPHPLMWLHKAVFFMAWIYMLVWLYVVSPPLGYVVSEAGALSLHSRHYWSEGEYYWSFAGQMERHLKEPLTS